MGAATAAAIIGGGLLAHQVESSNQSKRLAGQEKNRQEKAFNRAEKKKKD